MGADLSIINLIFNASIIVQLVMLILLLASILSWQIIFEKYSTIRQQETAIAEFYDKFWNNLDFNNLYNKLSIKSSELTSIAYMFTNGFKEFLRLQKNTEDPEVILTATTRALNISESRQLQNIEKKLSTLATLQSVSPYIGLFGTVWGIMHAFRALGTVQQATLSMVAPGISEALIATAMGLIVAIPAGIAYNKFATKLENLSQQYSLFREEFIGILYRKLHSKPPSCT